MKIGNFIKNDEIIPDTHFFVYKNKEYPIKFDYFKYTSEYFSELENKKRINLLDPETEGNIDFSDSTVQDFIDFVQNKEIILSDENVFGLNYLSNKYEVHKLNKITNEYIFSSNPLFFLDFLIEYQNHNNNNIDLSKYEKIISVHIEEYINDDRLLQLDLQTLYRIIKEYFINEKGKENFNRKQVIDFLIKVLDKEGRRASILFEFVDFCEYRKEYLQLLTDKYSDIFDFQYIKKALIEEYIEEEKEKETIQKEKEQLLSEIKKLKNRVKKDKEDE